MIYRVLNNDNISLLGFGLLRPPLLNGEIDYEQLQFMVDYAIANGVNYFDTAYAFGGKSKTALGCVLSRYDRNKLYISTKLGMAVLLGKNEIASVFNTQLKRLKTHYIDYYLFHMVQRSNWRNFKQSGLYDFLYAKKLKGEIRYIGFSFHDTPEFLKEIISEYDWDFAQLQLNYLDWRIQNAEEQYKICQTHGLPVIVMEPVRGGELARLPGSIKRVFKGIVENNPASEASYAIRWAASLPQAVCVLSGMSSLEQVCDNIATMNNFQNIKPAEQKAIEQAVTIYLASGFILCTACGYCVPECPQKIDIPTIFSIINDYMRTNNFEQSFIPKYRRISPGRRPNDCIKCYKCVLCCPQKLDIPGALAEIQKEINKMTEHAHPDTERCRILLSLIKSYGIRHFVISPGNRNVTLTRLLEANQDFFRIYHAADERSAGYFAVGLAAKLRETVAMCCTSGTAVSNYVPPVTEAFHQEIPLLVITSDRYPAYLGHMESQTIKQYGLFDSICKKCVTLPVAGDALAMWETRVRIADAILEINRHGSGPVQINVPMEHIDAVAPPGALQLSTVRKITRISYEDPDPVWRNALDRLKISRRIMIIHGQRSPLNEGEQKLLSDFSEKYNCVILTDHLSNVAGGKVIHFSSLLRQMSQNEFNDKFFPDLVITFGAKLIMGSPLIYKLRDSSHDFELWRVARDGRVMDTYQKLSTVFECSDQYFLNYFIKNAEDNHNDEEYFGLWQKTIAALPPENPQKYDTIYTVARTLASIPENSLIHLGVGNTLWHAGSLAIKNNIEVYCNMGTNGIDGSASSFMGQAAAADSNQLCVLLIGDLSFFYDMNSLWNKELKGNIRILLNNDYGSGFLRHRNSAGITHAHSASAKGWVKSLGFRYMSAASKDEFDEKLPLFLSRAIKVPIFFEVFQKREDLSRYDMVIFYGCGQFLRNAFMTGNIPVTPDEIWDINAENIRCGDISWLNGIQVKRPDFDINLDKSRIAVVITLYDGDVKDKVTQTLRSHGFSAVFDCGDCC